MRSLFLSAAAQSAAGFEPGRNRTDITDKLLMKRLCGMADILSVHTESLRRRLTAFYNIDTSRIRVVPHGYFGYPESTLSEKVLREKYQLPPDRRILLFFGTVRENKGLDFLLHAMTELQKDYFLLIAGEIAQASARPGRRYEEIIRKNGLDTSLVWIKRYISDEEVSEVFKIADAVVLPYKRSFYAQSGVFNLAANYEKPCLVSDVGGLGETVREFGLGVVVEPEDAGAMVSGIRRLFESDRESYGFYRYKQENNWDRVAGQYVDIYERLLSSKGAP